MLQARNKFLAPLSTLLLFSFIVAGCASQTGGSFSSGQTRQAQTVNLGTITMLERAFIENDPSLVGTLGGAVVGGVAGSTLGGGRGRVLTTLGGAVLGGLIGTGIEKSLNSRDALEIVVRLDNGQSISVVQQLGEEERAMRVGNRVRVLRAADGSARVRLGTGGE